MLLSELINHHWSGGVSYFFLCVDMFHLLQHSSHVADRTDETSRALEQKRDMVGQVQDMQRKVRDEQIGVVFAIGATARTLQRACTTRSAT